MERTEIIPGIEAIGPALWLKEQKILIIGDLHLGYEEHLSNLGFLLPHTQFEEIMKTIKEILKEVGKPERIVINGDLKHEFGEISKQEWRDSSKLLDFLIRSCKKVILIKGNHDTILAPIANKKNLEVLEFLTIVFDKGKGLKKGKEKINVISILHGDKERKNAAIKKSDLLIIGHDHPAVVLKEVSKREKYKCFLLGKIFKKRSNQKTQYLLIMPSFLPGIEGMDVKESRLLSPYLQQSLDNFEIYILGDKVYKFGKLKDL